MGRAGGSRLLATVLSAMVAGLFLCGPGAFGAGASSESDEREFLALVNQERVARGLGRLVEAADLVAVARRHSARMADRDEVFHNANLSTEVEGWQLVGENVGIGPGVRQTHDALMESKIHRDVLLHPRFTQLGVGVVAKGPDIWLTQVFRLPEAEPQPQPEAQPQSSAPTTPALDAPTGGMATPTATAAPAPAAEAARRTQVAGAGSAVPGADTSTTTTSSPTGGPQATATDPVVLDGLRPTALNLVLPEPVALPASGLVAAGLLLAVIGSASLTTRRVAALR